MKSYTITVNGNVYDVTVEEGTGSTAGAAKAAAPKAAAPKAAPKAAAPAGAQGAVKVNAPMPGKILKVNVNAGAAVSVPAVENCVLLLHWYYQRYTHR